jgi:NAD(P)H-dependent FMN reductase
MNSSSQVFVIVGSVRAQRLCPRISAWVAHRGRARTNLPIEVVDLADWPLPMNDEPGIPALGSYVSDRTLAWSAKIGSADGFVLVAPQYNWGYPAGLKNALDHLYREWNGKAAMIISYGGHGGGKCASQLRQVVEGGLKMRVAPTMPGLELSDDIMRNGEVDPVQQFAAHASSVDRAFDELAALLTQAPISTPAQR